MNSLAEVERFVIQYRPKGLIVDTNIFLLLLIGIYDPSFISQCRLTQQYTPEDFELLKKILSFFRKIIIIPHVLTEISNLSKRRILPPNLYAYFDSTVNFLKSTEEHQLPLSSLLQIEVKKIADFGFTDVAILELAKQIKMPVLTNDAPFYAHSYKQIPVFNFAHIQFASTLT